MDIRQFGKNNKKEMIQKWISSMHLQITNAGKNEGTAGEKRTNFHTERIT